MFGFSPRRKGVSLVLLHAVCACSAALPASEPSTRKADDALVEVAVPTSEQIQAWIKQLGDDDFQTRESAQGALVKAGDSAYFALDALPPSDDPEVKVRIEQTLIALEDDAAEQLRKLGARVLKRDGSKHWNHFALKNPEARDEDLTPLLRLKHLEYVGFEATPVSDKVLDYCRHLTKLRRVEVYHANISDPGLEKLAQIRSLEGVVLLLPKMTNQGFAALATLPKLRKLAIFDAPIDGDGLVHLRHLKHQIEALSLQDTQVSDDDLVHLRDFSVLRALRLNRTRVTGDGLAHLENLPQLESLLLYEVELNDAAFTHIAKMPKLQRVSLNDSGITRENLLTLRESRSLVIIRVSSKEFTEEEVRAIQKAFDARGVESMTRIHRN